MYVPHFFQNWRSFCSALPWTGVIRNPFPATAENFVMYFMTGGLEVASVAKAIVLPCIFRATWCMRCEIHFGAPVPDELVSKSELHVRASGAHTSRTYPDHRSQPRTVHASPDPGHRSQCRNEPFERILTGTSSLHPLQSLLELLCSVAFESKQHIGVP